jgi:hypothetical protein
MPKARFHLRPTGPRIDVETTTDSGLHRALVIVGMFVLLMLLVVVLLV